jgi:uncharacterized membrane protein
MTSATLELLSAVTAFVGSHFLLSHGPIRAALSARLGEKGFTAAYSTVAAATLVWSVAAYRSGPAEILWAVPASLMGLATLALLPVTLLFVIGLLTPSPTLVGGEARLRPEAGGGILAITRHPFLWAVAIWAALHIIANGDLDSLVLFGGFLVLAIGGTFHIDARRRAKLGAPWIAYAARTSNIPFAALIEGRTEAPRLNEIGAFKIAAALAFYAGAIAGHFAFGIDPLAGLLGLR